jgi:hypothetical protein
LNLLPVVKTSTPHTEDTMQSIFDRMETVIARQESVFKIFDESTKLDSILAQITDITTSMHDFVITQLTGKVSLILSPMLVDEDQDVANGLIGDIADTIYPYIVLKPTCPGPEQYGDYIITFKNVRTKVIWLLRENGLEQVKNPQTNDDVEQSALFDLLLNQLCTIQLTLWDSC